MRNIFETFLSRSPEEVAAHEEGLHPRELAEEDTETRHEAIEASGLTPELFEARESIRRANDPDKLEDVVRHIREIPGSQDSYRGVMIAEMIRYYFKREEMPSMGRKIDLNDFTRTLEIRATVAAMEIIADIQSGGQASADRETFPDALDELRDSNRPVNKLVVLAALIDRFQLANVEGMARGDTVLLTNWKAVAEQIRSIDEHYRVKQSVDDEIAVLPIEFGVQQIVRDIVGQQAGGQA